MNFNRKELLKMPERKDEDMDRLYKYILIVPAGTKHDSGFMHIAIIGCWVENKEERFEICSYPDDINWLLPDSNRGSYEFAQVRTDCYYPQGILRFHGRGNFTVDWGSSTEVRFIPAPSPKDELLKK